MSALYIRLHPADSVGVLREDVEAGTDVGGVIARAAVRSGHKIALTAIDEGATVLKYGQPIGVASSAIAPGDHVHTHNLSVTSHAQKSSRVAPHPRRLLKPRRPLTATSEGTAGSARAIMSAF